MCTVEDGKLWFVMTFIRYDFLSEFELFYFCEDGTSTPYDICQYALNNGDWPAGSNWQPAIEEVTLEEYKQRVAEDYAFHEWLLSPAFAF
jgi:hypothetical protein